MGVAPTEHLLSQCALPNKLPIRDLNTTAGFFRVENLAVPDLSSPGQGVCQINVRFRHASIGDVTLALSAPNGKSYRLIEAAGSRPTAGTTWDITFVGCNQTPNPDEGNFIKPAWDSDQDWGTNRTYRGSYHPVTCLESINTGPANGMWTVSVVDVTGEGSGEIEAFEVVFCNPQGMTCSDCVLNAGRVTVDTLSYCGGDPMLSNIRIFPTITGTEPDPAKYSYRYVVTSAGRIIQIAPVPDLSGDAKGNYVIWGLSIANQDLGVLPGMIGRTIGYLRNELNPKKLRICGSIAQGFKIVEILSDPGTFHVVDTFICAAAPIEFGTKFITTPGIFVETLTSSRGCDSIVELRVKEFKAADPITDPGTLTCSNKPLSLAWTNNQYAKTPSYQWSTVDGSILSDARMHTVDIDLPGTYQLAMSLDQCRDTLTISVLDDGTLPELAISDVVMDCNANIGLLRPVSNATSYQWSGPFGYTASVKNIDVTEPGAYTLVATGTNCAVRKTIQVSADFDAPNDVTVEGGTIRCAMDTVMLSAGSSTPGVTYSWTGPNGFTSQDPNPWVSEVGFYTVRVTSPSGGCTEQRQTEVVSIFSEPVINITGATLDCDGLTKRIITSVNDPLASFQWTGPSGYTSTAKSPTVNTPGVYQVVVTDSRQCTYLQTAAVTVDTIHPVVAANDLNLRCKQEDFILTASVSSLHPAIYRWRGPNNFASNSQDATATQAGTYTLTVEDPVNGCSAKAEVVVSPDPQQPVIETENGVINCTKSQDTLVVTASCVAGCSTVWTGPNGFAMMGDTAIVTAGGSYQATVTDLASGCFSKGAFIVRVDTVAPKRDVRIRSIGCTRSGEISLRNQNNFSDWIWRDSTSGDSSIKATINTFAPTVFDLVSRGKNGCLARDRYSMTRMDDAPDLSLRADTINCANEVVRVATHIGNYPTSQIDSYSWVLPGGSASTAAIPQVSQPGNITLSVVMKNGCVGSVSGVVDTNFSKPAVQALGGGFRCRDAGLTLDFSSTKEPLFTSWTGPNAFASNERNPIVPLPGVYTLNILGSNGCAASDTALVYYTDRLPQLELVGDTITCYDPAGDLAFRTDAPVGYSFKWLDPGGRLDSLRQSIRTTLVGPYQLEIIDQNECRVIEEVRIEIDTISIGQQITSSLVSCAEPSTQLTLDTFFDFLSYRWSFDSMVISTDRQPTVIGGGIYTLATINTNGCEREINHQVRADTISPKFDLPNDTLDCSVTRLTLRPTVVNNAWSYAWQGPNGFTFNRANPLITEPGIYTVRATSANQCITEKQSLISSDVFFPEISVDDTFLPCSGDSVRLSFSSTSVLAEANWFGPNNFYVADTIANTLDAGVYYIVVKAPNGCQVVDSLLVNADPQLVAPILATQNIDCTHPTGSMAITNVMEDFAYTWIHGPDAFVDTMVTTVDPGDFRLEALHIPSACLISDQVSIVIDTVAPAVQIVENDSIICTHREITLGSEVDTAVLYRWSTLDGTIVTLDTLPAISVDTPGLYQLEVTSRHNSCVAVDNFLVEESFSDLTGVLLQVTSADCHGDDDAVIRIDSVRGGDGPYMFSLGGDFFTSRNAFTFLTPQTYTLHIKDVNGCAYDTTIMVDRAATFDLAFPQDEYRINLGDDLELAFETDLPEEDQLIVDWSGPSTPDTSSCQICPSIVLMPLYNTEVKVGVLSQEGCLMEETVLIRVTDPGGIFVPNAFTPNNDGVNDFAEVFTGANIQHVASFEIYDRWGNNVFSAFNFPPGSEAARWNGNYRGELLNPGVFIYQVKAIDIRGKTKILAGDMALLH